MISELLLEIIYILSGMISVIAGIYAFKDSKHPTRFGTGCFWIIFGLIFIIGKYIPPVIIGVGIVVMAILSLFKQVTIVKLEDSSDDFKEKQSLKIGSKIWIPALSIGTIAMILSPIPLLGGLTGLGIAAVISFIIALFIVKESPVTGYGYDAPRLLHNMGAAVILPQLLGSLGTVFSKAEVGSLISNFMSTLVPIGNPLSGVILYCVSMMLFTMIMGNSFAAFAVITAGIGIPFVIAIGGDPLIVGALGLTAGSCGTLMTPMAANFNLVPASIMEINDHYSIIKQQIPIALVLLLIHIVLMYFLAF
ncbi:MAG: 5-oxoproline transporter, DUF979 family subunit [Brevinema sp.]